jgi:hypothetical protein
MSQMRAKLQINSVTEHFGIDGAKCQESLSMNAVGASKYPEDGSDEDNTYAKWSPSAVLSITIANPTLFGNFKVGEKYYVDFTMA